MLNKILWTTGLSVIVIALAGFFLPAQRQVERAVIVDRPASVVFTLLNDYRHFNQWSPWAGRDPAAAYRFSGPHSGAGARMDWSGDPRIIGTGWQRITESLPYQRIGMYLDFGDQGTANSAFVIEPFQGGSRVTWKFDTDVTQGKGVLGSLLGRYFGIFLERWVGDDYEQGLASFKSYAEGFPSADFSEAEIRLMEVNAMPVLYVEGQSSQQANDVAQALAEAFGKIIAFMAEHDIELAGQPMAITRGWDEQGYRFEAALPVSALVGSDDEVVRSGLSPEGLAVRLVHHGGYGSMLQSYEILSSYMAAHRLAEGKLSWEHYVTDPGEVPESELVTHIYYLVDEG